MVVEDSGGMSPVSSTHGFALLSRNLCLVGCTLERDQLVALSTGASREALLSGGALLPRGVFAKSRN